MTIFVIGCDSDIVSSQGCQKGVGNSRKACWWAEGVAWGWKRGDPLIDIRGSDWDGVRCGFVRGNGVFQRMNRKYGLPVCARG